jgi:hypothetical protein
LITFSTSYAQDQLFKKDNSKIDAKILEINQTEVKYKLFTYQDGPTITILKSEIAMIIYQNGSHEVFNNQSTPTQTIVVTQPKTVEFKPIETPKQDNTPKIEDLLETKNLISCNILEPLNGTFGINYLREFANNYFNVYVPISVGFTKPFLNQSMESAFNPHNYNYDYINNFTFDRKVAEVGLAIHFQTSGKKAVTHFVGPYVSVAQYTGTFDEQFYYNDPYTGYYTNQTTQHGFVMNRYYFMINNGILFRINKSFNMMMMAAVGYSQNEFIANDPKNFGRSGYYYVPNRNVFPINAFKFNLSMGYRFGK